MATRNFSKGDQESLEHLANLAHLFHHRNKNQHRRSIWWRHFSTFRRQLRSLVEEVRLLNVVPATHLQRSQKKIKDKETQSKISQRLGFWQDKLVPKWQHAFSQIIADGRFAPLGLMLEASLAQICQIVGITSALEDVGQLEVEKVLHQFGNDFWGPKSDTQPDLAEPMEDVGEVIAREDEPPTAKKPDTVNHISLEELAARKVESTNSSKEGTSKKRASSGTVKKARKKQKKGDAIDDLFSGLG